MIKKYVKVLWNNCTTFALKDLTQKKSRVITSSLHLKMLQILKCATTLHNNIVDTPPNSEQETCDHHIMKICHQVHKQH
jgi:hypothetical protein